MRPPEQGDWPDYRITKKGSRLLAEGRGKLKELFSEVVEGRDRKAAADKKNVPCV